MAKGPPVKNGQGHVREGSGVGFRVRLFVRFSLQGLYGRVSFEGLSVSELWPCPCPCPFFIGDPYVLINTGQNFGIDGEIGENILLA